jgi:hypothetical protein
MIKLPTAEPPSLEQFLGAPDAEVSAVAPATVVLAVGGTRRAAVLAGFAPDDDGYTRWSHQRMIESVGLLFSHGVRHIFTIAAAPSQFAEVGPYRERLVGWIAQGLGGPEALRLWGQLGWRVRIVGADTAPELAAADAALAAACPADAQRTLWWYVNAEPGGLWRQIIGWARRPEVACQEDLVAAMFGERVPLAQLCLSFGKPIFSPDVLPLPLLAETQCYWSQRPGYGLDQSMVRRILYDYAYLRHTWRHDKRQRYASAVLHGQIWRRGVVLGLGRQLGDFWYPLLEE